MEDQRIENLFVTLYPASRKYLVYNIIQFIIKNPQKATPSIRAERIANSYFMLYGRRFIIPEYLITDTRKICVAKHDEEKVKKYESIMDRFLVTKCDDLKQQVELAEELHELLYPPGKEAMDLPLPALDPSALANTKKIKGMQKREKAVEEKVEEKVEKDVDEREAREEAEKQEAQADSEADDETENEDGEESGGEESDGEEADKDGEESDETDGEGEKSDEDADSETSSGSSGKSDDGSDADDDGDEDGEDSDEDGDSDIDDEMSDEADFDTPPTHEGHGAGTGGEGNDKSEGSDGQDTEQGEPSEEDELTDRVVDELNHLNEVAEEAISSEIKNDSEKIIKSNPYPYKLEAADYTMSSMVRKELTRLISGLTDSISYGHRTGRVHMSAARRLEYDPHNRNIFKKRLKDVAGDARMAVSLVIDTSGSMGDIWSYYQKKAVVARVAYILTNELEKLGHAAEVRLFASIGVQAKEFDKRGDWSSKKFEEAGFGTDSTHVSMEESIEALNDIGKREDIKTKILIVLSDGEWSDSDKIIELNKECKRQKITTAFIQYNTFDINQIVNVCDSCGSRMWGASAGDKHACGGSVVNKKLHEDDGYDWAIYEYIQEHKIASDLLPTMKRVIVNLEKRVVKNIRIWEGR
jgi:hypothetical protein